MGDSGNTSGLEAGGPAAPAPAPAAPESSPATPTPPEAATPPPPAKDRSRRWLWIVLGVAAALVIAAIVLIAVRFGDGAEVPDLAGLSVPEATSVLEEVGLVFGKAVYTDGLPAGVDEGDIVGQLPPAGMQAEKGTKVDVIVAKGEQVATVPDVVGMSSDQAAQALGEIGLKAKSVEVEHDAQVGVVVDQSPQAGTKVAPGSEVTVMVSAGRADTLVPDVVGSTQDEATSVLTGAGYKVETKTGYDEDVEKGLVADQSPGGGTAAEPATTVSILVSAGRNPEVMVPAVVGLTEQNAAKLLEDAGLEPVSGPSFSDAVPVGVVISQDPDAGAAVAVGSAVSIAVSQGPKPAETATVPDVVGKSEPEATGLLVQAGYQVAVARVFSETVSKDAVGAQAPAPGNVTPPGITVALLVSDGPRPGLEFATVPDVRGMTLDEATAALDQAGLMVASSELYTQLAPKGQVFAQLPPAGYPVAPGSTVVVIVSKGPYVQVNPL